MNGIYISIYLYLSTSRIARGRAIACRIGIKNAREIRNQSHSYHLTTRYYSKNHFSRINPKGFHDFFTRWVQALSESLKGKTVVIDGKKLRGLHDRANGKSAIRMVSAWASQLCLVRGQFKTDDKSNLIIALNSNGEPATAPANAGQNALSLDGRGLGLG